MTASAVSEAPVTVDKTILGTATLLIDVAPMYERAIVLAALAANTETVYIGGSAVTTSIGIPLAAGEKLYISGRDSRAAYYAIRTSVDQHVRVMTVNP